MLVQVFHYGKHKDVGAGWAVLAALDALTPAQLVALDAACASDGNADSRQRILRNFRNLRDINVAGVVSSKCALPPPALPPGAAVTRVCQLYLHPARCRRFV